jgi:hypothetical protein
MSKEKSIAQQNKEEFNARVNAEFGGAEEWASKKLEIAKQTGADNVYVQKDVLATQLAQEGYIYKAHIGRCRFTVKLQPEDVGLDPKNPAHKEFINQYLALGNKLLLPAELLKKLNRIDNNIRRIIEEKYAVPTVVGPFVPFKNVEPMKEEIEKLKAEYFSIRDEIIAQYDDIKEETRRSYREFAKEVFRLIRKDPYYYPTDEEIERFVQSAMSHFPGKKEIYSSFYVTLSVGVVETTEFLSSQEARLRLIKEREKAFRDELALIERQLTEGSRIQAEHERQRLLVEKEEAKTKLMKLQAEQKAIADAIAAKREEYLPKMEQVFADLAGAVHGIIFDAVNKVTKALKTRGELRGADIRTLGNLAEKVRTLAINPDPQVERWMEQIQEIIDSHQEREQDEVTEAIYNIRSAAAREILSIGCVPRTIRGIGMADIEAAAGEEYIPVGPRQVRMHPGIEEIDNKDNDEKLTQPLIRQPRMVAGLFDEIA